ncbi:MAG TPA: transglutaminase family protein [Candidatus Dormibacteraeota bacterium]|nr:transglutaminase family protein [Candidatus Dormibacteraeota bacterium]
MGSGLNLYAIAHSSRHRYPAVAQRSRNEVRLQPRKTRSQRLEHFHLEVSPDAELSSSVDYFGNAVWLVSVEAPHLELVITAHSEVRVLATEEVHLDRPWERERLARDPALEFALSSPRVPWLPAVAELARTLEVHAGDGEALYLATRRLPEHLAYLKGSTSVMTSVADVLERRVGVCQDFAHVMLALCRYLGWPARYVSGYWVPDEDLGTLESHAWVEVATPEGEWVGLDPTYATTVRDHHVSAAVGRDYDDAAPLHGVFVAAEPGETPEVEVVIRRITAPTLPSPASGGGESWAEQ